MFRYLKEVGRGKRGSRDLTYEEAYEAASMIATGEATPVQIAAFLMAERIKMESADELIAFVQAFRERSYTLESSQGLDCAGPYDGRNKSFMATIPAAMITAAAGVPVVLHGCGTLPPKNGITFMDIWREFNLDVECGDREYRTEGVHKHPFLFVPSEEWSPVLARLRSLRLEMGVRTALNTVEKLMRWTGAPYMKLGIYHGTVFEKTAEILARVGVKRGLVVQGMEGSEDVTTEKRTRAYLVENGEWTVQIIDPELLGVYEELPEKVVWDAAEQAQEIIRVLDGERTPYRGMALLNGGINLWLVNECESIDAGIRLAGELIDNGAAKKSWEEWKASLGKMDNRL